jgi:hypothetical protein
MAPSLYIRAGRWLAACLLAGSLGLAAGCGGDGEHLVPVTGKVTVGSQVLTGGVVTFIPDKAKHNSAKGSAIGTIGADGTYTLTSDSKSGAPPGWYKVTVSTKVPPAGDMTKPPPPPVPLRSKYTSATTTDLFVEVVDNVSAGHYDLKLVK